MTRLYLVQHGLALPKEIDPERALSEQGRRDVMRMAQFLTQAGISTKQVMHSGKLRASQTAELLAAVLAPGSTVIAVTGINPNDPPAPFAQQVNSWIETTMVVGHLPFMAKLAEQLTTGTEDTGLIDYQPGSVVCLERTAGSGWTLQWMIRPELLRNKDDT